MESSRAAQVFIPGGLPKETYVERKHLGIEGQVTAWAQGAHTSLLSVSGPTKTGKTVLLKRFFPDAVWFSGGAIDTAEEFWAAVCDELEVFTDYGLSSGRSEQHSKGANAGLDAGFANLGGDVSEGSTTERGVTRGRTRSLKSAARKALANDKPVVVIDDFHYIPQEEQAKIIRGVKDLVFEGVPIILVAVPHRAYDAVRVEKEMTYRVENVPLGDWGQADLEQIAVQGFAALGVGIAPGTATRLAVESFGSPHLMQSHCLALALSAAPGETSLSEPEWEPFFRARAAAASKGAFDLLKQGPRQRDDRKVRTLKSGIKTDIYGAVLAAIAETGTSTQLRYEEVRAALKAVLAEDPPQRQEVTNVLEQMTGIARNKIEGEPVLEYDVHLSTLYIADPFFAYYLRWAPDSLKELNVERKQPDLSTEETLRLS